VTEAAPPDAPVNLSESLRARLSQALMRAELRPHQRLKFRELAARMGASETPVREAIMQLVHEGALEIEPRRWIRVRRLSLAEYVEIRDMRLELEAMAAVRAMAKLAPADIETLAALHDRLAAAEAAGDWTTALQANFDFHFGLYRRSEMPALLRVLEGLWVQVGPTLAELYPHAAPSYVGQHQHLNILDALRRRDAADLRLSVQQDLIEGGRALCRRLAALEAPAPLTPRRNRS
jgi:DNA-binding GntR family transcriptional regulator